MNETPFIRLVGTCDSQQNESLGLRRFGVYLSIASREKSCIQTKTPPGFTLRAIAISTV
ncbi:hypothetical protein C1752_10440 [Acaryochloris thomasi RCC1774]|uniref:Uncharacterized protein n=1 Tax=Acaryochloris thomasi RCC1774 TaxID=1764569 RepID=A0A2W1J8D7_9CYAN|nr:hypothetical protein [Acaryochloris thomasi]PZD70590.1 hypothetical protein C1752_10440 [Acaryochloris thomasi RCC1774]